jgi:serine/arginine repetitive matrix protein 2
MSPLNRVRDFVVQGAQALSPRLGSVSRMEDPFGPNPSEPPRPASAGSFLASLGRKGSAAQINTPSIASSTRATAMHDEEAMSWQGEYSPPRERSASRESSIHAAHGSPAQEGGAEARQDEEFDDAGEEEEEYDNQYDEQSQAGSEDQEMEDQAPELDEEEDIWAIEAQRPTPGKAAQPRREPIVEPPRRSKIPSPWRRNSKRLVYSDELHRLSEENAPQSEADELSMLSQQNRPKPQVASQKLAPPKNVDLSEFFSSPATLPDAQDAGFGLFKALDAPSLEQGSGFGRSVRGLPPVGSASQRKQPFGGSRASQPPQPVQQKVPQMFQRGRNLLDVNNAFTSAPPTTNPLAQSSSPGTPERVKFAHVPQKTNFTPRSRLAGNNLFQPPASKSLFGSNPVPVFSVEAAEDDQDEQDVSMLDDSSFIQPQLKPLPSRAMSPSKSSFRSPLKPKTPGRVVEFTSSTLSPLSQAQVRAERRASASPEKQLSPVSSHGSSVSIEDKENQQSESELEQETISASASASASMRASPQRRPVLAPPTSFTNILANTNPRPPSPTKNQKLSRTEWTRDHWVRLDQLLQARRQGVLQFQLQLAHAPSLAGKKRSPEGQRLIGKKVSSQGEEMLLEDWHIDIVDAFCAEVGGWEADDIARRLFAAMVGEERRRLGLVPTRG